jgi:hypothetical protein
MNPAPNSQKHLYCTAFLFGSRKFDLNLYADGSLLCYDHIAEDEIEKADSQWHNKTDLWPETEAMKLVEFLRREYTIVARLPEYDMNFIVKKLLPGYRRRKTYLPAEEICIRAILLEFFWKKINPQLSPPVPEGTPETF